MPIDSYVRTYYMSRRIDVPPFVAKAAYDAHAGLSADRSWMLRSSAVRLDLRGAVREYNDWGWGPLRNQRGTLIVRRHQWPVELELLPWSDERTELGLFPRSRLFCAFPPDAITRAGHELLDLLAARMNAWAEYPLRDWALNAATAAVES